MTSRTFNPQTTILSSRKLKNSHNNIKQLPMAPKTQILKPSQNKVSKGARKASVPNKPITISQFEQNHDLDLPRFHQDFSRFIRKLPPSLDIQRPYDTLRPLQMELQVSAKTEASPISPGEKSGNYQTPTLSSLRRSSRKIETLNCERNFNFSRPSQNLPEYDSSYKTSKEELSSASSPGSKSSKSPLRGEEIKHAEVLSSKTIEEPSKKKSGFFHLKLNKINNPGTIENLLEQNDRIEEEPHEDKKPAKRRISSILTKELEARYGIRLIDPDSGSDLEEEEKSPIKVENQKHETKHDSFTSKEEEEEEEEEEELRKEENQDDQEQLKERLGNRKALVGWSLNEGGMADERDFFSSNSAVFFQMNQNLLLSKLSEDQNKINTFRSVNTETDEERKTQKERPIAATFGEKRIVQPLYMKSLGSMCITEFWSQKSKKNYLRIMKNDLKPIKVHDLKRELEQLYRPDKWKKEEKVKAKIQNKKHEKDLELLKNVVKESNIKQYKQSKTPFLPVFKLEIPSISSSMTPRTPNKSPGGSSLPHISQKQSLGTKNLGILANMTRNELILKKAEYVKEGDVERRK